MSRLRVLTSSTIKVSVDVVTEGRMWEKNVSLRLWSGYLSSPQRQGGELRLFRTLITDSTVMP